MKLHRVRSLSPQEKAEHKYNPPQLLADPNKKRLNLPKSNQFWCQTLHALSRVAIP